MDGSVQVRRRCGYVIAPRLFPRVGNGVEIGRRWKGRGGWWCMGLGGAMEQIGSKGEEE
jgi:hypothetical protein